MSSGTLIVLQGYKQLVFRLLCHPERSEGSMYFEGAGKYIDPFDFAQGRLFGEPNALASG
jgi:hypothetical protein